jgi:hypothetical protein
VEKYLWRLKKEGYFHADTFPEKSSLWDYPTFLATMQVFRHSFNLSALSFKQIDKFIWTRGEAPVLGAETNLQEILERVSNARSDPKFDLLEVFQRE